MVNKITWQKAGYVTRPGRYMFTFGWLTVTPDDIDVWERFPRATFTLVKLPGASEGLGADPGSAASTADEFHLGAFDISLPSPHGDGR